MQRSYRLSAIVAAVLTAAFVTLAHPADAHAFCGFYVSGAQSKLYNDATMVSLMRQGQRTVLTMQNGYQGPPKDFAMVVPVPVVLEKKQVKTLDDGVFERLDRLTAPRLVEYWEHDPCAQPRVEYQAAPRANYVADAERAKKTAAPAREKVTVHAKFKVGEYDVVVLSSTESTALEDWLNDHQYNIPDGAAPYFKPYIQNGQYFFVARVDVDKVTFGDDGRARLSPLRFHYDTDDFVLPVRLGLINSKGAQDLIAFILAQNQRYEVANYPNVTVPTNIAVNDTVKKTFGGFYNELFNTTLKENPKAVVTEYAWKTSSCDPCPGPPLRQADILSLGADVIDDQQAKPRQNQPGQKRQPIRRPIRRPRPTAGWVVTRLHARYTKHTLGKDLMFKAAPPIQGGRGMPRGSEGTFAQKGAHPSNTNNFQGRYIVLNHWEGAVDCEDPRRGRWGGPNGRNKASATGADDLAFDQPESDIALASYVAEKNVAGLKLPTSQYSEPIGTLFADQNNAGHNNASGASGAQADDGTTNQGGGSTDDHNSDDDSNGSDDQETASHPRGGSSGGCASSGGAKKSGVALLMVLLVAGGIGRWVGRRNDA